MGLYWVVGTNLLVGYAQELTDGAGFSLAHQQMFGVFLSTWLADKMGQAVCTSLAFASNLAILVLIFAGSPTIIIAVPQLQYMRDPEHYFLEVDDYEEYKKQKGIETTY